MKILKSKNEDFFDAIKWVSYATERRASRPFCEHIHLKGRSLLATDGHRAHRAELLDLHDLGVLPLISVNDLEAVKVYRIKRNQSNLVELDRIDLPARSEMLPEHAWGFFDDDSGREVEWDQLNAATTHLQTLLYTLIASIGVVAEKYGYDPHYLLDAVERAHSKARVDDSNRLHLEGPASNYVEYRALVMPFRMTS